jgi:lysyl-tRNA synthetase class 2
MISVATPMPPTCKPRFAEPDNEALEADKPYFVKLAGRIMLKRVMGKASFATIQDMSGRIQLYVTPRCRARRRLCRVQEVGHGRHRRREGYVFKTKTGELSCMWKSICAC